MPAATISGTQLAKLVDITERHIQRLTLDGILKRATDENGKEIRGRYDLVHNVRAYCHYLREQARLDDASESKYVRLRNQKMAAEAETSELKLQLVKKKLHRSEDVEFIMTRMLTALKARLLAIPSRVTRLLLGLTDFQRIFKIIQDEIELALRELHGYDPNSFANVNEEYLASVGAAFESEQPEEENEDEELETDNGDSAISEQE